MSKDPRHRVPGLSGPSLTRAVVLAGAALALASSVATAAWSPAGFPFSTANGEQSGLRAVTDGRGGFIAAWIDTNGGTPRIFGQRVDSTGATQWGASGVTVSSTFSGISDLTAASDGQSGVLLAWIGDRAAGKKNVFVQRLNASGAAQWTANGLLVDPTSVDTLQGAPAIDSDGSGGAIVAWKENRGNTDWDVFVQRVRVSGATAWLAGGVGVDSTDGDGQGNIRLLGDGAGGAWVAWDDSGTTATRTFFQRYDSTGARQWGDGGDTPVGTSTDMDRTLMTRVAGGDSLMVAWAQAGPDRVYGTLLRRDGTAVDADGNNLIATSQLPVSLLARTGGFLLVIADASDIRAQAISSNGTGSGSPNAIATGQTLNAASNVTTVADGTGGYFVVWASGGTAYARRVRGDASPDWAAVPLTTGVTATQTGPVAVGGFDLLAAWVDDRNSATTGLDLFAQRVSPTGVTGRYHRIYATMTGTGSFSSGGGRTWVRFGDSLRVRYAGSGVNHVTQTVVGGTNLGPVPNYTFRNVAGDSTLQVTVANTPVGMQIAVPANAHRAFSVPATLAPDSVSSLFGAWMPYDPVRWRLGHWEPDSNRYLEPTSGLKRIQPATGYWFIGAKDTTLTFSGTFLPETQYSYVLRRSSGGQGWNQFGSPFMFPVAVSQLRLSAGPNIPITDAGNTLTDRQVLEWDPATGSYDTVGVLLPGRAYWLWRQSASAVSLQFPYEWNPVAVAGGLTVEPLAAGDWSVGVTARAGERTARLVFGAAPVAAGRWNSLSGHAPPASPGESVSLVARVSDWGEDSGEYASVFRPDAATLSWDFDASVTRGLAETALTFEFTNLPAGRRVRLSEPAAGWSREVAHGEPVALALSGIARRLRLEVLADGPVTPTPRATALRAAGPNPFRESASLAFSIARGGPLRWDVFDLAGRRVVSGSRTVDAGEHVVTWDGRDEAGHRVEPGLYLLRWQADGRTGTARLVRTD